MMNIRDMILEKTRQGLDVFHHYISTSFVPKRRFKNPLYEDTNASCYVYFNSQRGCYLFKDFGATEYSGDCFWFVATLNGWDTKRDFVKVLRKINDDMNLYIPFDQQGNSTGWQQNKPSAVRPQYATINTKANTAKDVKTENTDKQRPAPKAKVTYKEFSKEELEYWGKYGITQSVLERYHVRSGNSYSSINTEGKPYTIVSKPTEPMFVYKTVDDAIKVYRPFSKLRFLYAQSADSCYVFGLGQLPSRAHVIFITGGEKDVMTLAAHGFNAVCFNSETADIPNSIMENLSRRFKHIILLFDMDATGIDSSKKRMVSLSAFNVKRMELPLSGEKKDKDISDFYANGHKTEKFKKILFELLKQSCKKDAAIYKSCELDYSNPPSESHAVVTVNDVPLGTCDNLFCLTGGEGVGKSNFISAIISGSLVGKSLDSQRTLGMTISENPKKKAVLLFDTEQSERQLYKNVKKTIRRAYIETKPDFFHAYHMTAMSRKERLEAIRSCLELNFNEHGGIQLVVIDGVADLVRSANDELESIEVVDELYRLAGFYRTCIICVLHFVPNGIKLRGHIGSELQRKAAGILSIEKDDNPEYSVVKVIKVRDGSPLDIPMLLFGWDNDEDMFMYRGVKSKEDKERRKQRELRILAVSLFKNTDSLSYSEIVAQVMQSVNVQERTAKEYVRYMRDNNIIEKMDNSNYQIKLFDKRTD